MPTRQLPDKHLQAVAMTLSWADEAADQGDFANALAWLATVEALGHGLSEDCAAKREVWRRALGSEPNAA